MLNLGQKLTLESSHVSLVAVFKIDRLNLTQNSAIFENLNHF